MVGQLRQAAASGGERRRAAASGGKLRKCIFALVSLCVVALCACSVAPTSRPGRASERAIERYIECCVLCLMFTCVCFWYVALVGLFGSVPSAWGPTGAREAAARLKCRFVARRRTTSLYVRTAPPPRNRGFVHVAGGGFAHPYRETGRSHAQEELSRVR